MLFFPVQRKFGSNFTVFVSGGAPLIPEVFTFWNSMGFTVLEGYGLTETSPVLCVNTMERQLAGSVGPPLPGVEVKIEGKEVLVRGDNVFPGYYENEQASRDAFTATAGSGPATSGRSPRTAGWSIKGREKELIVTGAGVNVYPDELEAVLNKIAGVKESCVIGSRGEWGRGARRAASGRQRRERRKRSSLRQTAVWTRCTRLPAPPSGVSRNFPRPPPSRSKSSRCRSR